MAESDSRPGVIERIVASHATSARDVMSGRFAPAPAPGFRYAVGARVLDLVSGLPVRIAASYVASASTDRVYEVVEPDQVHQVRLERQLEQWNG